MGLLKTRRNWSIYNVDLKQRHLSFASLTFPFVSADNNSIPFSEELGSWNDVPGIEGVHDPCLLPPSTLAPQSA